MNELGTPNKPILIRSTSLGQPSKDTAYISAVTEDGRHVCLGMTRGQWKLLNLQITQALYSWPEDVQEPAA